MNLSQQMNEFNTTNTEFTHALKSVLRD